MSDSARGQTGFAIMESQQHQSRRRQDAPEPEAATMTAVLSPASAASLPAVDTPWIDLLASWSDCGDNTERFASVMTFTGCRDCGSRKQWFARCATIGILMPKVWRSAVNPRVSRTPVGFRRRSNTVNTGDPVAHPHTVKRQSLLMCVLGHGWRVERVRNASQRKPPIDRVPRSDPESSLQCSGTEWLAHQRTIAVDTCHFAWHRSSNKHAVACQSRIGRSRHYRRRSVISVTSASRSTLASLPNINNKKFTEGARAGVSAVSPVGRASGGPPRLRRAVHSGHSEVTRPANPRGRVSCRPPAAA
jgi:hypothetical protein